MKELKEQKELNNTFMMIQIEKKTFILHNLNKNISAL